MRSLARGLVALVLPAAAQAVPAGSGVAALVSALRAQPELRARFAQDPQATMLGFGIDPAPFALRAALSEGEVDALLARWDAMRAPVPVHAPGVVLAQSAGPPPQVAVYGPPEMMRRGTVPPVPPAPEPSPPPPSPAPSPPAPVYGPPPSPLRR